MSFLSKFVEGDEVGDWLNPATRGIGSFGDVEFVVSSRQLLTFRDFKRNTKSRFATHNLLLQKPKLEFLGRDLTEITFKIQLVKSLGIDVEYSAEKLRRMCEAGADFPLVIGAEVIGRFVVEQIQESAQIVDGNGSMIVEELELTLKEYAIDYLK